MTWSDLPGWFDYQDLYDQVVAEVSDGAVFVELGVYAGRSLAYLAGAVQRSGKRIDVHGVDRFDEIPVQTVEESLRKCGVKYPWLTLLKSDTADAARLFVDGSADFVFIDADHSYEGVARDIAAWRPKMKAGAIMAGHDRGREGIDRAVHEAFGRAETMGPLAWVVRL